MRRAALAIVAVALVVSAVLVVHFFGVKHDFPAEVMSPPPARVVSLVPVPAHQRACMAGAVVEQHSRQARFQVGTFGKPGPPLVFTIHGASYNESHALPGGYPDNVPQVVTLQPPSSPQLVTVCIRNRGATKIALYAAGGAAASRLQVTVDGRPTGPVTPDLTFYEGRQVSLGQRLGTTVSRVATFRGFLGHTWIVYLVAVLFLIGMPAALVVGFARTLD